MPKLTAIANTVLKSKPVDSMKLAANELISVKKGQVFHVEAASIESANHYKIILSGSLTAHGKSWKQASIFKAHWEGLEVFTAAATRAIGQNTAPGSTRVILPVKFQDQLDNQTDIYGTGARQCCLTSVSAALRYIWGEEKCQQLVKCSNSVEFEDWYDDKLQKFGDTTDSGAHVRCLATLGVEARFRIDGAIEKIQEKIKQGVPVPLGVAWKGSGHWVLAVGFDFVTGSLIINDPNGKRRLGDGGLASGVDTYDSHGISGEKNEYSPTSLKLCWTDQGAGSGWWIDFLTKPAQDAIQTAVLSPKPAEGSKPSGGSPALISVKDWRLNSIAINMIEHFEGLELDAYICPAGVWTIGLGTTRWHDGKDVPKGAKVTREEAITLFRRDCGEFIDALKANTTRSLSAKQVAALTSWIYNCGAGAYAESTLRKVINSNGSDAAVAEQIARWTNQGMPGLIRRREAEIALWQGKDWS